MNKPLTIGILVLAFVVVSAASGRPPANHLRDGMTSPAEVTYSGPHSEWVRRLLDRVGRWECPSDSGSDSGKPPETGEVECQRDAYVRAAVLYAWATECYHRREEDSRAEKAANEMLQQLKNAQEMCSNAPSFGGGSCPTEKIYRCGELR